MGRRTDVQRWAAMVWIGPDCWEWLGTITKKGYGQFRYNGQARLAHRFGYERFEGEIPDGYVLDHLCRNRSCVRPSHLEAVTVDVNTKRSPIAPSTINANKTHCKNGHQFNEANTYHYQRHNRPRRKCRQCRRVQKAA